MVTTGGRLTVLNPNVGIVDRAEIGLDTDLIDVYEESVTQIWPLGTRFQLGERVYRYFQSGAVALGAGKGVQPPVIETNGDVTDMAVDTPAIGARQMEVTNGSNTAITANEFTGGWLVVNDDTGEAYAYQIRINDAIATSGSGTIYLYDQVKVALGAGATVSLTHSTYYKNIIHPSPPTQLVTGFVPGVMTADYFGWLQTWGPAACLQQGTLYEGQDVMASRSVDGAVESWKVSIRTGGTGAGDETAFVLVEDSAGSETGLNVGNVAVNVTTDITGPVADRPQQNLGVSMHPNADGENTLIYLKIAP